MLETVEDVLEKLEENEYLADENLATVLFLAYRLPKPLLVEGPAGVGKTELALAVYNDNREEMQKLAREAVQEITPFKKEDPVHVDQLLYRAKAAVEWFMFTFYLESRREKGVIEEKDYTACQKGLASLEKGIRELLERDYKPDGRRGLKTCPG